MVMRNPAVLMLRDAYRSIAMPSRFRERLADLLPTAGAGGRPEPGHWRALAAAFLMTVPLLLAACGDGNPTTKYVQAKGPAATSAACTALAGLFPGFSNGGVGSDTFTINGTAYVDSATCDPLVLSNVDPDTQDIQVNVLWGWVDAPIFFTNHMFISLWGRNGGLTTGAKNVVNFGTAANAVNEFRYDSTTEDCAADVSGGPILGGVTLTSIGAVGGIVAGSFSNIPLVVNSTATPCATPSLTGTFSMTRDPDDPDGGSGSVASPVSIPVASGPIPGSLTGNPTSSGNAFFSFNTGGSSSRTISVTGATLDPSWELYSSPNFVGPVTSCNSTPGTGTASCTANGLTLSTVYYV